MTPHSFCNVYRVRYRLGLQMFPNEKRYHNVIFISTATSSSTQRGEKLEIAGSITDGYTFQHVACEQPELSSTFVSKDFLGFVRVQDYGALVEICRKQPVPTRPQQKWRGDGLTGGYARCKENGCFYEEGEEVPPLFRCTEWTEEYVMPALSNSGLLHTTTPGIGYGAD